jgi:tetratricopeptide (TPR) repeat protein
MATQWQKFNNEQYQFDFSGDALKQNWNNLHGGNLESYPANEQLQEAWRCYHQGDFSQAVAIGSELGGQGAVVTAFATLIYAQYMEQDSDEKIRLFKNAIALCEQHIESAPNELNLHYMHAVAMGRYSQFISMVEALQQGYGKKIKDALDSCLALNPSHAEALVTFGGWNAEIVDKAGAMLGKIMYGATKEQSIENYQKALALTPSSPIPHIEYAYGLQSMYGDMKLDETIKFLEQGIALKPADAMQALDQQAAKLQLNIITTK